MLFSARGVEGELVVLGCARGRYRIGAHVVHGRRGEQHSASWQQDCSVCGMGSVLT
jgi:hypothetical protein